MTEYLQFEDIPDEIHHIIIENYQSKEARLQRAMLNVSALLFIFDSNGIIACPEVQMEFGRPKLESVTLSDVLEAMDALGSLSDFVALTTDKLLPFIAAIYTGARYTIKGVKSGSRLCSQDSSSVSADQIILQQKLLFKFIASFMFSPQFRPPPELTNTCVSECFLLFRDQYLLNSTEALQNLAKWQDFVEYLGELGRISNIDLLGVNQLDFTLDKSAITEKSLAQKRIQILDTTRQILLDQDFNTAFVQDATERGGVVGILGKKYGNMGKSKGGHTTSHEFLLDKMHISSQAQSIMEIIYQNLQDLDSATPNECISKVLVVGDILALYRAVTVQHQKLDLGMRTKSMIIYNDCMYFVHHLSTLQQHFCEFLTGKAAPICTFVDEIPLFYQMGQESIQKQHLIESQEIESLLQKPLEEGIMEVLNYLENYQATLEPISRPDFYHDLYGQLANQVIAILLEKRASMNAFQVQYGIDQLKSNLSKIPMVSERVALYDRFIQVCDLLEQMDHKFALI